MKRKKTKASMAALVCLLLAWTGASILSASAHKGAVETAYSHAIPAASAPLYAADPQKPATGSTAAVIHAADRSPALNRVMWTVLIVWAGISLYLYSIDRKISRLEKERDER